MELFNSYCLFCPYCKKMKDIPRRRCLSGLILTSFFCGGGEGWRTLTDNFIGNCILMEFKESNYKDLFPRRINFVSLLAFVFNSDHIYMLINCVVLI